MSERKLIYVDDLEKALLDTDCDVCDCDIGNGDDCYWGFSRDSLEEIIKTVPTVDAVPVVHGHWIGNTYDFHCSVCGRHQNWYTGRITYCPNCGAKNG